MVNLGDAATIDAAVARSRLAVVSYPQAIPLLGMQKAAQEADRAGRLLADLVYQPLREAIGDASTLLISPDGGLWLFPWEALPTGKGRFLVEEKQIVYVVTGRAILDDAPPKPARARPVRRSRLRRAPHGLQVGSTGRLGLFSPPVAGKKPGRGAVGRGTLPAAARRGRRHRFPDVVARRLRPCRTHHLSRQRGLGKRLQGPARAARADARHARLFSPRSTFRQPPPDRAGSPGLDGDDPRPAFGPHREEIPFVPEPLLRCGLALAGANEYYKARDANDGIVTGLEILGTDLRGTELVVLDACETGVGAVRDGEGTAGLHQAFQLAGARVVVASLWRIPAVPSNRLLEAFFANIARGQGTASSLRDAELKMIDQLRKTTGAAHPALWAAFTITGDCRETAGSRQPSPATASGVATKVAGDPVSKSPQRRRPRPPGKPTRNRRRTLIRRLIASWPTATSARPLPPIPRRSA